MIRSIQHSMRLALAVAGVFTFWAPAESARAQGYPVTLSATVVSASPGELRLEWDYTNYYTTSVVRKIYRRAKGDTPWGTPVATLGVAQNTLSYSDTTLTVGAAYEYKLETFLNGSSAATSTGYVSGGVNVPMPENRGTLVLLVDSSQASALAPELAQLQQDLAGDGWTVVRSDLARSVVEPATAYTAQVGADRLAEIAAVKNVITAAYNADPANVKAVYIVGHLAVPYSGLTAPDGHGDHYGAWPADTYYADVNGTWTDTTQSYASAADSRNWNVPGDGKFDQYSIPSDLELQVGRVDFKNMTCFPTSAVTETELLRRYLRKAHDYRKKQGVYAAIDRRALVINAFSPGSGSPSMTTSIGGLLGRDPGLVDIPTGQQSPWFSWMEANPSKTYLIGSAQTAGGSTGNGAGGSYDFGLRPSRSVFNVLFGSYLGDWEYANNFMRASLAGNATGDSLGLTCFWGGRPNLYLQSMGLGETIGYSARVSQNSDYLFYASQYGSQGIHTALMGDPALRLYSVQPPQNLQAASSNGSVTLSWAASTESNLLGYLIYRGTTATGPFTKLTASPIAPATYTDSSVSAGTAYTYLVKTVKLETTPSGSFENPSSASFATIAASGAATSIPPAPTNLQVTATNSTTINLTWNDNATGETGYRIERRSTPSGSFSTLATLDANSTSYTDAGPLTAGVTFYYRVIAVGSGGDSLSSDEAAVSGYAGSLKFASDVIHLSRAAGYVDVPVRRIGGTTGTVTVGFATEAGSSDSALPGVDYTATSATLTFADGETLRTARVTLLKSSPQPLHMFTMRLSNPTGGAQLIPHQLTYAGAFATVLLEDPAAPLASPWQTTVIGGSIEPGAVGQVGNDLASVFWGGSWNSNATEDGRFIYQSVTGDVVMTAKITAPSVDTAALMVRSSAANNYSRMVAIRFTTSTSEGAKFWARNSEGWPWDIVTLPAVANTIQAPYWARITRAGDQFTGEVSPDGVAWTFLGSASVSGIPTTAQWGFFQGVGLYSAPQRAQFANISINPTTTPAAPVSLAAVRTSTGGLISWTNVSSNATGVRVERRLSPSGSFSEITTVAGGVNSYADSDALANEIYEYRVRAYNNLGDSPYSGTAILSPLTAPSAPSSLTATGTSLGTVSLAWESGSLSSAGYSIERRAEGDANFTQIGSTTALTFTDATAAADTGYEYRIRAYNSVGNSAFTVSNAIATPNIQSTPITTALGQGADAHISQTTPATNYGSSPTLDVDNTISSIFSDAFLRFDLASVSTSNQWLLVDASLEATLTNTVTAASLFFYGTQYPCSFPAYLLINSPPAWSESTITWDNAPWHSETYSSFTGGTNGRLLGSMVAGTLGADVPAGSVTKLQISTASNKTALLSNLTTALAGTSKRVEFYFNRPYGFHALLASRENPTYAPPTFTLKFQKLTPNRATNLSGTVPGIGSVSLQWADTSPDETGFRVEVSTDGGSSYSTVATVGTNVTSLTTSSLPRVEGNHLYRVVAFNALGDATPSLTVTLAPGVAPTPPPAITTTSLPGGTQGAAYSQTLAATGGEGALTWSLASGTLPAGLTLSSAGVITGTPSAAGTRSFTVRVTDSVSATDTRALTLTIQAPVVTNAVYEGFNYTPGTDLSTQTQPAEFTGWAGGHAPGYTPVAGSLSYTNGGTLVTSGNALSGGNAWQTTGMRLNLSNAAWDPFKVNVDNQYTIPYPGSYSTVIGKDNTTVYVCFLMKNTSDQAVFGLYNDGYSAGEPWGQMAVGAAVKVTSSGAVALRVGSYTAGTFDVIPANGTNGTPAAHAVQDATATAVTAGSTSLYVLKFEFGASGNGQDKVSLFVNPAVGGTEPGTASASIIASGNVVFSSIGIYLGNSAGYSKFDELRFGATWADVVPAVPPALTGIAAWFDSYGLPTDGTGDGSPTAILAGDGITNLMKYALGIDPEVSGYQGHLTTGTVNVSGADYLSLTYTRPEPAPTGVTYAPQTSADLSAWSGSGMVEVSSAVAGGLRTVTVRDGTAIGSTPRRFIHLEITAP